MKSLKWILVGLLPLMVVPAQAGQTKFEDLFAAQPVLVANDRAMLCFAKPDSECPRTDVHVVAESVQPDGTVLVDVLYSFKGEVCAGQLIKRLFQSKGWATIEFDYGLGCSIDPEKNEREKTASIQK